MFTRTQWQYGRILVTRYTYPVRFSVRRGRVLWGRWELALADTSARSKSVTHGPIDSKVALGWPDVVGWEN